VVTVLEERPAPQSDLPGIPEHASGIARRFGWSCAAATALSAFVFVWLLTDESFNLFRSLPFSNFYDIQARALLHGHWNVPPAPLWIEGFRIGGRTYMYYGPVPALLRIPVLLFTHRFDGRLSELSMLLAFIVALVAVSRLSWKVRLIFRGNGEVGWTEALLAGAWTAAIGLGSVLVFLGSDLRVYYEAELWGAALALCAFDAIVGLAMRPTRWRVVAAGGFTTLAMMTRGSVGAGPLAALGLVAVVHGVVALARRLDGRSESRWSRWSHRLVEPRLGASASDLVGGRWQWLRGLPDRTRFASLVVAVLVPAASYVTVNEIKFRTLISIPFTHQSFEAHNPARQAVLAANHGSLFGLEYIPTSLLAYLRPDALRFTRLFPFVAFPGPATVIGHVAYDTRDFASSVTTTMPLLFIAALVGLAALFRPVGGWLHRAGRIDRVVLASPERAAGRAGFRLAVVGAAVGTFGTLTIAYIANRYLADLLPLVVLACLVGFHVGVQRLRSLRRRLVRSALWTVIVVLAVFGVWVNIGLALVYQRELEPNIPTSARAQFVSVQAHVDSALFGAHPPPVASVSSLPRSAPVGSLAVVGNCTGLYQFDGSQWFVIELGPKGGGITLQMTFPPGGGLWSRQPVVEIGGPPDGELLAVQEVPGHKVRLSYRSLVHGQPWWNGSIFAVVRGRTYRVTASFDARLDQVNAAVDGTTRLNLVSTPGFFRYPVLAPGAVHLGTGPPISGTSTRFDGSIHRLPTTTPICSELVRRPGR
jgi:hypothetical protein